MKEKNKYLVFISLGYEILVLVLVFTFAGKWADDHWGWKGLGAGGGALLAMALWIFRVLQTLKMVDNKKSVEKAKNVTGQETTDIASETRRLAAKTKGYSVEPGNMASSKNLPTERAETPPMVPPTLKSEPQAPTSVDGPKEASDSEFADATIDEDGPSKMSH